jgi:hypothetical protein
MLTSRSPLLGLGTDHTKLSFEKLLCSCVFIRCCGKGCTTPLPSNDQVYFVHFPAFSRQILMSRAMRYDPPKVNIKTIFTFLKGNRIAPKQQTQRWWYEIYWVREVSSGACDQTVRKWEQWEAVSTYRDPAEGWGTVLPNIPPTVLLYPDPLEEFCMRPPYCSSKKCAFFSVALWILTVWGTGNSIACQRARALVTPRYCTG